MDEVGHQFLAGRFHVALERLDGAVPGKGHHIVYRISAFIKIGHTASPGRVETDHLVFWYRHNGGFPAAILLVGDGLVDVAPGGKDPDNLVGLHLVYDREADLLVMVYQRGYFFQYRYFHQLICLFLVQRNDSLPYGGFVQLLDVTDS